MAVMVFLKCAGDISFMFMMLGSIAVHFGASVWACVAALAVICLAEVLSFVLDGVKSGLRLLPFILPLGCAFLPGMTISSFIICGIIFAYTVFVAATHRYMAEDSQRTIFKITAGGLLAMLLILLLVSAEQISFSIVIFAGLISLCCSILLLRSLRHDSEVYSRMSFQMVNLGVIAAVLGVSVVLSTRAVTEGIFKVLSAIYKGVAYVILTVITYAIRAVAAAVSWLKSLFGSVETAEEAAQQQQLDLRGAADLFDTNGEYTGLPTWIKIVGIVVIALIVIGILTLIFRKLAGGRRGAAAGTARGNTSYSKTYQRAKAAPEGAQVGGVRKQYRKYLAMVRAEGQTITADETSADIAMFAPPKYRTEAAAELRKLYLEARYNGEASKEAADRAKELVKMMR